MNIANYLQRFEEAAKLLDPRLLEEKGMTSAVGVFFNDSVFLKLYKPTWASPNQDPLTAESRIFFSIWVNDETLKKQELFYNIHALKLRKLKGYKIESRKFAADFRADFSTQQHLWPNVSTNYGPLTLMQGAVQADSQNFNAQVLTLCNQFLEMAPLIDQTLLHFKH